MKHTSHSGRKVPRNVYKTLVVKSEGQRPLERHKCRWDDYFEIGNKQVEYDGVDCIHLPHNKYQCQVLVKTAMSPRVPHRRGISWPAELILVSLGELCFIEIFANFLPKDYANQMAAEHI